MYIDKSLYTKEYLLKNKPSIFFAGDSRAQRQLIPKIAAKKLFLNQQFIANIAIDSGDSVMLEYLIKKFPEIFKNSIVIFSISPNQVNDDSKDQGYFTNSMISKLSFKEKTALLLPEYQETLISYYKGAIKNFMPKNRNKFVDTYGFHPTKNIYIHDSQNIIDVSKHPWYKNWNPQGIKYKLTQQSLSYIKQHVKHLVLFTGPYAPSYWSAISTEQKSVEKSFQNIVDHLSKKLDVPYIHYNYFSHNLNNQDFSDMAHLNEEGAKKFTSQLIEDFKINHKKGSHD